MSEIIQSWLQDRLGILLNMCPEIFAERVKDGYLLAAILKSYEIITIEQLGMIPQAKSIEDCLDNFQNHILTWLSMLDIHIDDEELHEIVNAKGKAGVNLFYRLYLELHSSNKLRFITEQKLKEKLRPKSRFQVERVQELPSRGEELTSNIYDQPLRDAKDIIHWQKDKIQMLQAKCKEAREEYIQHIRNSLCPMSKIQKIRPTYKHEEPQQVIDDEQEDIVSMTYEELEKQQNYAAQLPKFVPDPEQSKKILKTIRAKHTVQAENVVFKTELERDIFTSFWDRVKQDEEVRHNDTVTEAILKQSIYEKRVQRKIGEVKLQKHTMLENKRKETEAISNQISNDFVKKLVLKKKELDETELSYYMEKERVLELHKRLYEHKKKLKHEMAVKICTDTVADLVALACQEADYIERVGEEPPRRMRDLWKTMFVKSVPFKAYVKPTEVILKKPEDRPEDLEEIIHLEIERQDIIDDVEFQSYMEFQWPWTLNNIEMDEKSLEEMMCALNILGNLVHNLLLAKYPFPSLPTKHDFSNITVSACVNGIDESCLPLLQEFLSLRHISVVQVQDCVNFCVKAYVEESSVEAVDLSDKTKKKGKGKEENKRKEKENKSDKKSKKGGKNKMNVDSGETTTAKTATFKEKMVQTPRYYPDELIPLTEKAELGKTALEVLEAGDSLTKHIVAAMFVEYIKSKPDIEGWVLINFPQTYEEAAALEEVLTGRPVPRLVIEEDLSIIDLEELEMNPKTYKHRDSRLEMRVSRILPQPVVPKDPEFYDSALTAYIKPIKRDTDKYPFSPTLEDIEDNPDPLDKFYAKLGCNYHFYYNRLDFDATKYLAKLILGDYSVPMKSSVELFGDKVTRITPDSHQTAQKPASASKTGEKKKKPKEKKTRKESSPNRSERKSITTEKIGKGKGKDKDKKGKKGKVVIVHEDKSTQEPEVEEEEEEVVEQESEPEVVPKPGEKNWPYTNLPFNQDLQIAFATVWENAEDVYVVDMEQVLFLKRTILEVIMPFVESVKNHMATFMNKPDEKQLYLREFQMIYNEFDQDFRADEDFKGEMFCRINEFREKLIEICDWKMVGAEQERVYIIDRNWTATQMIQLTNQYVSAMQLEIDRCVDTMKVLTDYYTAVVTKMASETAMPKELLARLPLGHLATTNAVNSLLQNVNENREESLHSFMEHTAEHCRTIVDRTLQLEKADFKKIKEKLDVILMKEKEKDKKKGKRDGKNDFKPAKRKTSTNVDEALGEVAQNIIDEWSCVLHGEVIRVKLRIELLKNDFFTNLDETLGTIRRVFYEIYDTIRAQHENEVESVNAVCKVFSLAVEKEVRIQEELVLTREDFYVNPEVILFPDELPPVRPLTETIRRGVFTVEQLDKIVDILLDLAPTGYMPERSFLYLLQDMITNKDDPILVPELWQELEPRQLERVSKCLFDDIEYVQWRDFIVMNLMVPFPTEGEIMCLRCCFRQLDPDSTELVADYQCYDINYWFEPDVSDGLRLRRMRQLLCKMYRVKGDYVNYTALLLDFCKDHNPALGLAKALGVCLGKQVCFDMHTGENFVEVLRHENIIKRKKHAALGEVMKEMLTEVVDALPVDYGKEEVLPSDIEIVPRPSDEDMSVEIREEEEVEEEQLKIEPVADLVYYLPWEALITVITSCLPWNAKVQNIEDNSFREICEQIYESCRCSEFDNKVLCHEFLNNPMLTELLTATCKFSVKNPLVAVEDVLEGKEMDRPYGKTKKF